MFAEPSWHDLIAESRKAILTSGWAISLATGLIALALSPLVGSILRGKRGLVVGAAIGITAIVWIAAALVLNQYSHMVAADVSSSAGRSRTRTPGVPQEFVVPDRHLTKLQHDAIRDVLSSAPATTIGISTIAGRPERTAFASELAQAFRDSGWTVIQTDVEAFANDQEGVLLIIHSQPNMPNIGVIRIALAGC